MITIPLATVVSYLTRKGVGLACLEGAPIMVGSDMQVLGPFYLREITRCEGAPPDFALYLGRDAVCLAAMGWATRLLSVAREPASNAVSVGNRLVELWTIQCVESNHRWVWNGSLGAAEEWPAFPYSPGIESATYLPGRAPATPAARLRAVLEYEMGRDQ